jgi:hypothetical protein
VEICSIETAVCSQFPVETQSNRFSSTRATKEGTAFSRDWTIPASLIRVGENGYVVYSTIHTHAVGEPGVILSPPDCRVATSEVNYEK